MMIVTRTGPSNALVDESHLMHGSMGTEGWVGKECVIDVQLNRRMDWEDGTEAAVFMD